MSGTVRVPATEAPVIASADVVVCGGGAAGLGAAIAAAREGARTVLVERWPFFGGNATAASLGSICGQYVGIGDELEHLHGGIAREWIERLLAEDGAMGPVPYKGTGVITYAPWSYKRLADAMVSSTEGLTPILHAPIHAAVLDGDRIDAVVVGSKQGPVAVRADVFVDATGDADVALAAGCRVEAGEAPRLQYPSMQFLIQGVDMDEAMAAGLGVLADRMRRALEDGTHRLTRSAGAAIPTGRPGEAVGAMTRIARPDGGPPDGTDLFDLTRAELDGRASVEEAMRFLRDRIPGFGAAWIQDTAVTVGIRETRHVLGAYVLSAEDARSCAKHPDGIAASAWPLEFHTEGTDTRWEMLPAGDWFEIPYRSLVAVGVRNLLVAGRCLSAEHEALASARVTATAMATGEAAGLAAASAANRGAEPADLDGAEIRSRLASRGALRVR